MNNTYVYYYQFLPKHLQQTYMKLLEALKNHEERTFVPFLRPEDLEKIIDCIILEHPNISFFQQYTFKTYNELVFCVEFHYFLDSEKDKVVRLEMENQAQKIAAYAKSVSNSKVEQAKAVYEYFSKHVVYDFEYEKHKFAHTPAGPLLYAKGICKAATLAYKICADLLDIPLVCVQGTHDGVPHAWALIRLSDKWYPLDPTVAICAENKVSYDGFCMLPYPKEKYEAWNVFPLPQI